MNRLTHDRAIERLIAVLEAERVALASGDFDTLGTLYDAKLAAITDAQQERPTAKEAHRLADLARGNARRLAAAASGVKSAMARLSELRQLICGQDTYTERGRRRPAAAAHRFEKRF